MTVSSETNKVTYNGNGVTTVLAYTFKVLAQTDLIVQKRITATGVITDLILTTDYTVSGVGEEAGGNVTLVDPATDAPAGSQIVIRRNMALKQETDYTPYDTFPAEDHETALDRLTMICQQQVEALDRSIKFDPSISTVSPTIIGTPLAGYTIRINVAATGWEFVNLSAIGAYSFGTGTGVLVQSVSGNTALVRTMTGTANEITVTNGDGVSANPTWALPTAMTFTGKTVTGGTFSGITVSDGTFSGTIAGSPTYSGLITFSAAVNHAKGSDIASATSTDIGAATGNYVVVTGTTTITGFGTVVAGTQRIVRFSGALLLTHNATSLILPTAADITTATGDVANMVSEGSGNWRCTSYTKATGIALAATDATISTSDITTNNASTTKHGWLAKVPNDVNQVPLGATGAWGRQKTPVTTVYTSGTGTYTTPTGALWLRVRMVGAGAGGHGNSTGGTIVTTSTVGGDTNFGSGIAGGGKVSITLNWTVAAGGTTSGSITGAAVLIGIQGGASGGGVQNNGTGTIGQWAGGSGGASAFGGGGGSSLSATGIAGVAYGSGGAGGGTGANVSYVTGSGGGAGAYLETTVETPSASYSYTVGAGGSAGLGTNYNGGAGAGGIIIITAHYQ